MDADSLRRALTDRLVASGRLHSPEWRAAFEAVPRHAFVPAFFIAENPPDGSPSIYRPVSSADPNWLELAYGDDPLVTQLDGRLTPADVPPGSVLSGNAPTSSASMPAVVALMWEALDVADGDRVLEIGTGTGYSTALGCHRLGDSCITSVEVDPDVAERARRALDAIGYRPDLVVGDGLLGAPGRQPFDRVIATCNLRHIPPDWIRQCRPGAVIVTPIFGSMWAGGLAVVTVTDPAAGLAEGRFVDFVGFMPARSQTLEPVALPDLSAPGDERLAVVGPEVLTGEPALHLVVQLALPSVQYFRLVEAGQPPHLLVAPGSYAALTPAGDGWSVRQGGARRFWDEVEAAVLRWREAGEPGLTDLRIAVTPTAQTVSYAGHLAGHLTPR